MLRLQTTRDDLRKTKRKKVKKQTDIGPDQNDVSFNEGRNTSIPIDQLTEQGAFSAVTPFTSTVIVDDFDGEKEPMRCSSGCFFFIGIF